MKNKYTKNPLILEHKEHGKFKVYTWSSSRMDVEIKWKDGSFQWWPFSLDQFNLGGWEVFRLNVEFVHPNIYIVNSNLIHLDYRYLEYIKNISEITFWGKKYNNLTLKKKSSKSVVLMDDRPFHLSFGELYEVSGDLVSHNKELIPMFLTEKSTLPIGHFYLGCGLKLF